MNLGTMKTALSRIAGVDSTDPLADWINAGMHEFEDAYDWPFLEGLTALTTTANSPTPVSVPTDLEKVIEIKVTVALGANVVRPALRYVPKIHMDEGTFDPIAKGEPTYYTLLGNNSISFWPIPNGVYSATLYYQAFLPDLVGDSDTPVGVPTKYHYTIVRAAAMLALDAESEEDRAETARTVFEDRVERHISKLGGSKQSGSFNTVRDAMGYGT